MNISTNQVSFFEDIQLSLKKEYDPSLVVVKLERVGSWHGYQILGEGERPNPGWGWGEGLGEGKHIKQPIIQPWL